MPVYTVHAPVNDGGDLTATDKFTFVRDGFHFWAMAVGVIWLAWHRLWLALIGWIVLLLAVGLVLPRLGVGTGAVFAIEVVLALLLGFEAASVRRWTLSRGKWRLLDVVVADDEEAAERRFFDRWTARGRVTTDPYSVDRGGPPPTRHVPGQPFSRPPPIPQGGIIGLFPEPGGSR